MFSKLQGYNVHEIVHKAKLYRKHINKLHVLEKQLQVPTFSKIRQKVIFSRTCILSVFEKVSKCVFDKSLSRTGQLKNFSRILIMSDCENIDLNDDLENMTKDKKKKS